jgi:hypothetical protein
MSDPDLLPTDAETPGAPASASPAETMLPHRRGRPPLESAFVRVIATSGVVGIGVALGAILTSQNVAGWITGLVIALVSVILSAVLWSSQRL